MSSGREGLFANVTEVMVNGPDDVYVEREGRIATVAGPEHDSLRLERGTAKRVGPAAVTFRQSSDGRLGKLSLHPCRFGCQRSSTLPMLAPTRSVSQDCR
jgi:hypothetical protein